MEAKNDDEGFSVGDSCYVKGWLNDNRSFVFRAQPIENGVQKSYWFTIGRPGTGKGETRLGASLSLSEAQMAAMFLRQTIVSGENTIARVKNVIANECTVMKLLKQLTKSKLIQCKSCIAILPLMNVFPNCKV